MTEKEKMQAGLWFNANFDPALCAEREQTAELCQALNSTPYTSKESRKILLARLLPRDLTAGEESGFFRQFAVRRDGRYTLAGLMTVCSYGASYVVYTYVTPILTDVLGVGGIAVSPLLMVVGLCCVGGNLLSGLVGAHGGVRRTPLVLLAQAALFAAMPALLGGRWTGLLAVLGMCLMMYVVSTPVQLHALELAERDHPSAVSLCASTLSGSANMGIALGSFASSGLQSAVGLRALGWPAAAFALVGLGLNLALLRIMHKAS